MTRISEMNPLKIYLGDLTYDTISLSTEAFPLNIGYIAGYCKKLFGSDVEITLFKYIDDLENAILTSPPTILGLSNYAWNHRISLEMFKILKKENPNSICVMGGPNFPLDFPSQKSFLDRAPDVDVYVPIEGEVGFSNVVKKSLSINTINDLRKNVLSEPIDGCITRQIDGEYKYSSNTEVRTKQLDEIPSPYLTGILDKFFDGKLSPTLQTNRGCPFQCTYCVDGNDAVRQVTHFSIERVTDELNYIARHVPKTTSSMIITDLNFGMIPRDLDICDVIANTQKEFGYPTQIQATTGKNSKEKIIEAIKRVNGALRIWLSVQSMDQDVLRNVKRNNISVDQMLALQPAIREAKLPTMSEVIIGLPGETYQSHIKTLRDLLRARVDDIQIYTCMMLDGAEMNTPEHRKKWGIKTKYRILPRDFVKLKNGKKVLEIEEVIIESDTLTFNEYAELRVLAFIIFVTKIGIVYEALFKLLEENNIDLFDLFHKILKESSKAPKSIQNILERVRQASINELWDSPEEIQSHFQNDIEYEKLLNGETGINVVQFHHAIVMSECIDDWTDYTIKLANELLHETANFDDKLENQFNEVTKYCKGLSHNTLGPSRMETNPEFIFDYDILSWLAPDNNSSLETFKLKNPMKVKFNISQEQYDVVENKKEIFGDTDIGRGQVIKRIPRQMLWRKPIRDTIFDAR